MGLTLWYLDYAMVDGETGNLWQGKPRACLAELRQHLKVELVAGDVSLSHQFLECIYRRLASCQVAFFALRVRGL